MHTRLSGSLLLGLKAGVLLHNIMSTKDPILAVAGDESHFAGWIYAFNPNSVIMLPPLEARASHWAMTTEIMRLGTTSDNGLVVIRWRGLTLLGKGYSMQFRSRRADLDNI